MTVNANPGVGDLRGQRRAAGLSQQRVAELADCSLSMVRLLESGYRPHSGEVTERIAAVLEEKHGKENAPTDIGAPSQSHRQEGADFDGVYSR